MVEIVAASDSTLQALEFPVVLQLLEDRCRTPYGKGSARSLRPASSRPLAQDLQQATREMLRFREVQGNLPLPTSADIRPLFDRLEVEGSHLTGVEIHLVVGQVRHSLEIRGVLLRCAEKGLREKGRSLPDLGNLARYLDGKTSPSGLLEDRSSTDLLQIRRQIASVSARLESELKAISARGEMSRALQDDFIALRNGRHVLPVRIDAQGLVEGIVHALSSSGATVYMEPLSTIPLNNDLVRLREQEEVEVQRLLLEFSDLLRSRLGELRVLVDDLAELDLLQARAILAEEMDGIDPDFPDSEGASPFFHLSAARHPLLERALQASGRPLVPLDLTLEKDQRILIVSGPNTGGKTVALKTVGLLALMAQSGLKIPATEARLPVFRRILIDIGDHQSIPDSLSTFSARMANISEMSRDIADPALVLLDEIGSGTDPEEGACLGVAIIDYFRKRGAMVLATTHQQGIKAYAAVTQGVANACMEFDETSLRPLYRLRAGAPGRSGGLDIAEGLGLPGEIVHHARSLLPRQREILDSYLRSLQASQEDLDRQIEASRKDTREARRREAERQDTEARLSRDREERFGRYLEETSARLRAEWERLLATIADRESERRLRREMEKLERTATESIRASLDTDLAPSPKQGPRHPPPVLAPGARVKVSSLGLSGVVDHVAGGSVTIRSGSKLLKASVADLEIEEEPTPPAHSLPPGVRLLRAEEHGLQREINLTGRTVEEALPLLDKYLDDASLSGLTPLRIIHGMGTGRLRNAVRHFLETHPHVESFSEAEEREGGRGVTLVRLHV